MATYTYSVLTKTQIKLLDDYVPAFYKLKFSEILDEALGQLADGDFTSLTTTTDVTCGRDLAVARALTSLTLQIGGGYGITGCTVDEDGNISADGIADFTVSGVKTLGATPANAGADGEKGMVAYDTSYIYICVATNTWMRGAIATW